LLSRERMFHQALFVDCLHYGLDSVSSIIYVNDS